VFFPGSNALGQRSSAEINPRPFDWALRSGRAVVYPVYKSTYERGDGVESDYPNRTTNFRDHVIAWARDVSRTLDYLETRDDIAHDRIGYLGLSWGAAMGPVFLAVEPRFKAAVLYPGGPYIQRALPEADAINFAPRVSVPVLELDGQFDYSCPVETAQVPFFNLLGVPGTPKRRIPFDTGHNIPRAELIRQSLDWFDRYIGGIQ
jgi:eukaryotic-like serine/threonine-protein kinase